MTTTPSPTHPAEPSTPTSAPRPDAIDPTTTALLAIFDGPLREVRFPDVDAPTLHGLAAAVRASADRVASARAALLAAQGALVAAEQSLVADEQALLVRCERALAYAHVYAAGDRSLREALDGIHLSSGAAPPHAPPVAAAPRRRGRPRKHAPAADAPQQGAFGISAVVAEPPAAAAPVANDAADIDDGDAAATAAE